MCTVKKGDVKFEGIASRKTSIKPKLLTQMHSKMQFFMFTVTTQLNSQGLREYLRGKRCAHQSLSAPAVSPRKLVYKSKSTSLYQIIFRLM